MAEVQKVGRDILLRVSIERYDVVESAGSGGNSGLGALKARVSMVKSGQHVEYTLRIQYEGQQWTMRKRFSEVADLHDIMKRRLPSVPKLPEKSAVRQFSMEYIEQRKAGLQMYLQELARRRDAMNCREVQQFFGLPQQSAAFRQPHGSEPVQSAEVHEAVFGITSFTYDPMQGLLLLGATDCSWTSRMDTKITNIKLPWEPAAPNLPTSQMSLWRQSPADLRFDMVFTSRFTHSISCVVLCPNRDRGFALCGLGDGTVGYHAIRGEPGVCNSGSTLPLLKHTAGVVGLASDDAEGWIISASKDNSVMVYDSRRQMIVGEAQTPAPTSTMKYSQEQKRLFCGLSNGRVIVWDTSILPIQQLVNIPDGADGTTSIARISSLDFDVGSSTLFAASKEGFRLWALKNSPQGTWSRLCGQIAPASNAPTAMAWAASSREILAGLATGAVVVYDIDSGEATFAFQAHNEEVTAMLWLDAPRRLLTTSKDKTMKIWDFPSLRRTPLEDQPAFQAITPAVSTAVSRPSGTADGGGAQGTAVSGIAPNGSTGSRRTGDADDPLLGLAAAAAAQRGYAGGVFGNGDDSSSLARGGGGSLSGPSIGSPLGGGNASVGDNPLASGGRREAAPGGYSSASPVPSPPMRQEAPTLGPALARPSDPLSGGAQPPVTAPLRHKVAGAKPGTLIRDDSDDDLAGWDS